MEETATRFVGRTPLGRSDDKSRVSVFALDIGYHGCKRVVWREGKKEFGGFPSVLALPFDASDEMAGTYDVVEVAVGDRRYLVGPDAPRAAGTKPIFIRHEGYIGSPEYMALFLGSLAYLKATEVELLVVGVPVTARNRKQEVKELLRGEHLVGDRVVTVADVIVTEQPMGANHTYLRYLQDVAGEDFRTVALHDRLLIDVGHVTVDAIGVTGARIIPGTSACPHHSVSRVVDKLAQLTGVKDLSRLSAGLLTGRVRWQAQDVALGPHMEQALGMLDPAIQEIENVLSDHAGRFEEVVLAGGGAFLFLEHVHQAFPMQPIILLGKQPTRWWLENPIYPEKVVTVAENLESYQVVVNGYLEGGLAWRRARA